jgi:glutamate N-acetyltransferase/amino-acid N-acetyltransferase
MLAFVTTDAAIPLALLDRALREAVNETFNAITVDGECSTNDSLFALASGASGVTIDEELYPALTEAFLAVSRELALGIVRGGEGATKLISIQVRDARTIDEARQVAHNRQLHWSRRRCTAPRPETITSPLPGVLGSRSQRASRSRWQHSPVRQGCRTMQRRARRRAPEGQRDPDRGQPGTGGHQSATIWTCDLSAGTRINGETEHKREMDSPAPPRREGFSMISICRSTI